MDVFVYNDSMAGLKSFWSALVLVVARCTFRRGVYD